MPLTVARNVFAPPEAVQGPSPSLSARTCTRYDVNGVRFRIRAVVTVPTWL